MEQRLEWGSSLQSDSHGSDGGGNSEGGGDGLPRDVVISSLSSQVEEQVIFFIINHQSLSFQDTLMIEE